MMRTNPDYTELYSGDLTGAGVTTNKPALAPGLYKWGTGVQFTGVVKFMGSSTDIWILQIANDLIVGDGANIIIEGGALPENIFWQVTGQNYVGMTAHVEGIFLSMINENMHLYLLYIACQFWLVYYVAIYSVSLS